MLLLFFGKGVLLSVKMVHLYYFLRQLKFKASFFVYFEWNLHCTISDCEMELFSKILSNNVLGLIVIDNYQMILGCLFLNLYSILFNNNILQCFRMHESDSKSEALILTTYLLVQLLPNFPLMIILSVILGYIFLKSE